MVNINYDKKFFMRDRFGNYLLQKGKDNNKIAVVNADLMGTSRNREFCEAYPERAFNVGIAEQNMISFAAGLAHEGFIPFTFSMAPFLSMRACEQCRTDVAYGNLNVRLVASYSGCSGGISGVTHWGMEDCAIMNSFPNMSILEPCDPVQLDRMIDVSLMHRGPIYFRISVEPMIQVYEPTYSYEMGKASIVKEGNDAAIIASGITVKYAYMAAEKLEKKLGIKVRVIDMHTIKPVDREAVVAAAKTGIVVVAQDHNRVGGLGFICASVIAEEGISVKFANLGMKDEFVSMAHAPYLYHKYGYDAEGIEKAIIGML